jgi:hypothetical protein
MVVLLESERVVGIESKEQVAVPTAAPVFQTEKALRMFR